MNRCLPPDDFEKRVMDKIVNVDIDRSLSPYARIFFIFSCVAGLVIASGRGQAFLNRIIYNSDMYSIFSGYYNDIVYSGFMDNNVPICIICITVGVVFIIYNILSGVRKNG